MTFLRVNWRSKLVNISVKILLLLYYNNKMKCVKKMMKIHNYYLNFYGQHNRTWLSRQKHVKHDLNFLDFRWKWDLWVSNYHIQHSVFTTIFFKLICHLQKHLFIFYFFVHFFIFIRKFFCSVGATYHILGLYGFDYETKRRSLATTRVAYLADSSALVGTYTTRLSLLWAVPFYRECLNCCRLHTNLS